MPPAPAAENRFAARLRGFGPVGLIAIAIILAADFVHVPLSAVLVLVWRWLSKTPWRELGYVRPNSWFRDAAIGVIFGIALKLLMKVIVMPALGTPPTNQAYQFLIGNTTAALGMVVAVIVIAGFGEETFFRGYMFERLGKLLGSSVAAKVTIVIVTSALFAIPHYPDQGLPGVEQAAMTGLAFGSVYAVTGRLFMPMVAHTFFDLTAIAIIYWNLEAKFARLIFN